MNFPVYKLEPLELEEAQVREVLRPIIHTILFNRIVNPIQPSESVAETFDVFYPVIKDSSLKEQVEAQLKRTLETIVKEGKGIVQISLCTFQTSAGFFYNKEKKNVWEAWALPVVIVPRSRDQDRHERNRQVSKELTKRLFTILKYVDDKDDHIPRDANSSSFTIECAEKSHSDWSALGKMITEFRFLS